MTRRDRAEQFQVSMYVLRAIEEIRADDDRLLAAEYTRAKSVRLTLRANGDVSFTIVWRKKGCDVFVSRKSRYRINSEKLAGLFRRHAKVTR